MLLPFPLTDAIFRDCEVPGIVVLLAGVATVVGTSTTAKHQLDPSGALLLLK